MGAFCAAGLMCGVVGAVQAAEAGRSAALVDVRRRIEGVGVLKDDMTKQGYTWKDFAVAGGAGAAAMTALEDAGDLGQRPDAPRRSRVR